MFLKKLFSHSLIYALGPQIPRIAGLFVLPIITRYLTSVDYGIYGVISSYAGIISAMGDLGFSILLVNSFFRYPKKWQIIWRQLFFYLNIWAIVYSFLLAGILYLIMPVDAQPKMLTIILLMCLPQIFFNPTLVVGARYFQLSQKPMYMAITTAITGVIAIFLNYYTIAFLKMGFMGWFWSTALSSALMFLFFAYPIFIKYKLAPIIAFRRQFLLRQLKVSLPTIPHNYSSYLLNSSDRVVMDRMHLKLPNIGIYNMAYVFGGYFDFIGTAIGMAISPHLTALIASKTEKSENDLYFITRWLQGGFLLGGMLVAVWSKELMNLLISNNELKSGYPVAIIIIMSYTYRPYYWAAISRLQYYERTAQLWKISFIAGILNIILNIIFLPIYGIKAAAVTTFAAMLYMGFSGFFLKAYKEINIKSYQPLVVLSIIILLTVIVYLIKDVNPGSKSIISLFALSGFIFYSVLKRNVFKTLEL